MKLRFNCWPVPEASFVPAAKKSSEKLVSELAGSWLEQIRWTRSCLDSSRFARVLGKSLDKSEIFSAVFAGLAQFLLDAKKLVVLGHAVASGR